MGDYYKIKALCMMLLNTTAFVKGNDSETKWVNFLIEDDALLKIEQYLE